ncbi:hypothetical protein COO60DRAFT_604715 [Scenedesmus sp. NREL 46B-D3]|nr:hypothetical protein COO60DRAFT_604715 [Scenedesmus sp. NREL 46B-D3]
MLARPYPVAFGKLTPPFAYPTLQKAAVRLCQAAVVLLLVKLAPAFVALLDAQQLLADALAPHLPARVLSALLTNTCADPEMMCGAKLCSLVSVAQRGAGLPYLVACEHHRAGARGCGAFFLEGIAHVETQSPPEVVSYINRPWESVSSLFCAIVLGVRPAFLTTGVEQHHPASMQACSGCSASNVQKACKHAGAQCTCCRLPAAVAAAT